MTSEELKACCTKWLQITNTDGPPHAYQVLNLAPFTSDPNTIRDAVQQRVILVARSASPADADLATKFQKYLFELEATLLDPATRELYDNKLGNRLGKRPDSAFHAGRISTSKPQPIGVNNELKTAGERQPILLSSSKLHPRRRIPRISPWIASAMTAIVAIGGYLVFSPREAVIKETAVNASVPLPSKRINNHSNRSLASPNPVSPNIASTTPTTNTSVTQETASLSSSLPLAVRPATDEDVKMELNAGPLESAGSKDKPMLDRTESSSTLVSLQNAFDLLELPTAPGTLSNSTSAGAIDENYISGLELALDSSAADLKDIYRFQIRSAQSQTTEKRRWFISATPTENRPGKEIQMGHFFIDERRQCRFLWELGSPFTRANQLANCLLSFKSGAYSHQLQLRSTRHIPRLRTDLTKGFDVHALDLSAIPDLGSLSLFIDYRGNKGQNPSRVEVPLEQKATLTVGDAEKVVLGIELTAANEQSVRLKLRADVRLDDDNSGTKGKSVRANLPDIKTDVGRLNRNIVEQVNDYVDAVNNIFNINFQRPPLVRQIEALRAQIANNPADRGNLGVQQQALEIQVNLMDTNLKKLIKTRDSRLKSIPTSYKALSQLISAYQAALQVHNNGELQYELVSKLEQGVVSLLSADNMPNQPPVVMEPFTVQLPGKWFRIDSGMLYNLGAGANDGALEVNSVFDKRVQPIIGRWRSDNGSVTLASARGQEEYKMHEGVMMTSPSAKLFRILN